MDSSDAEAVISRLKPRLQQGWCSLNDLADDAGILHEEEVMHMIDWLSDNDLVERDAALRFRWKENHI